MRVLTLGRGFPEPRSGMNGSFEWEQATALARRGIDVTYCYLDWFSVRSNRRFGGRRWRQDGVDVMGHNYPASYRVAQVLSRWRARILIRDLESLIRSGRRPDLVYAHYPLWTLPLGLVRHLASRRIPLVVMEHATWVQRLKLTTQERNTLREIAAYAHAVCCVSDDLKESLQNLLGDSPDLFVIPNMVSPAFDPVATDQLPPVDD